MLLLGYILAASVATVPAPTPRLNSFTDVSVGAGRGGLSVQSYPNPRVVYNSNYALIISSSSYARGDVWPALDTDTDAQKLSEALTGQGFGVARLSNPDGVTLRRVVNSFIAKYGQRESRLIIYYSGHGWHDDNLIGYLVGVDAPSPAGGASVIAPHAMSTVQIIEAAKSSHARHTLFIFDACYSGALVNFSAAAFTSKSPQFTPSSRRIDDVMKEGVQFLSSATQDEKTPDHGRFTPALIAGIQGAADYNRDGIVLGSELAGYLKDVVSSPFGSDTVKPTTPQYGDVLSNGGDIVFRYTTGGAIPSLEASSSPSKPSPAEFAGIKVIYFQKAADRGEILRGLERLHVDFSSTRSVHSTALPSDGIACSANTSPAAIKLLARSMKQLGYPVRSIEPIRRSGSTEPTLEIVSHSYDGRSPWMVPYLSDEVIASLSACPSASLSGAQFPRE